MNVSCKIARWFGGEIWVHWTFWFTPLFVLIYSLFNSSWEEAFLNTGVATAFCFFICIREVCHLLLASLFRMHLRDYVLYPVGGNTRFACLAERPVREFWLSVAMLGVNALLFLGLVGGLILAEVPLAPRLENAPIELNTFWNHLFWCVALLNIAHAIPAYPMDMGKVFRGALALSISRFRATEIAVLLTTFVCTVMGFMDLLWLNSGVLMIFALVLFLLSQDEMQTAEQFVSFHQQIGNPKPLGLLPVDQIVDDHAAPQDNNFSGFTWNAKHHLWIEWHNGQPISATAVLGDS